jgi:hypothetical protein
MAHHKRKVQRATTRCICNRPLRASERRGVAFAGLTGCVHKSR